MSASIDERNAASVLPEPVGAMSRVLSPFLMTGHACACAGVGAGNEVRNHSRTAGWNASSASLPMEKRLLAQLVRDVRELRRVERPGRDLVGDAVLRPADHGVAA